MRLPAPLVIVLACSSVTLSGCFDQTGIHPDLIGLKPLPLWANVDVVSLVTTHKTVFDHAATLMTGQDCSSPRAERDGAYCVRWPEPPPPPQEIYCYASLAKPTCYAQPYVQANDQLVSFVPASLPVR
jgi:hypothetical protein